MVQKIRSSIMLQLSCIVFVIFAILYGTLHLSQVYVRRLAVQGAENLAGSFLTQADDALALYTDSLKYHAAAFSRFPAAGLLSDAGAAGREARRAGMEEYFSDMQLKNQDVRAVILFDENLEPVETFGIKVELPERQRYLRDEEELNADWYFGPDVDFCYGYFYPIRESLHAEPSGMCVFILDRWVLEGTVRNIIKAHSAALEISDSRQLDLAYFSSGSISSGMTMELLKQDPDMVCREGNWQNGLRITSAVSISSNTGNIESTVFLIRVATILSALLLGILVFFSYYQMAHPLSQLAGFIDRAVAHPEDRLRLSRTDEIGVVASSLDNMLDESQKMNRVITEGKIRLYETRLARERMEILAYRNQINPHFLYNTLSCIRDMALFHDADDIAEITMALSDIFRYAVKGSNVVRVRDEIQYIEKYAKIIEYRFMGKIMIGTDVDEAARDLPVIRFFLQPLVENSVLHGLGESLEPGFVHVGVQLLDGRLEIYVRDNGKGMSPETLRQLQGQLDRPEDSTSIGLSNIVQRLRLFYKDDYRISIDSSEGKGTLIRISVPPEIIGEEAG